jgi:hypothetical protein
MAGRPRRDGGRALERLIHMIDRRSLLILCAAFVLATSGCGASDEPINADAGPVKYYTTAFRKNQLISLASFAGGLTYGFYQEDFAQPQRPEFAYAGFFMATAAASGTSSARAGHEYRFGTRESVPITLDDFKATEQALVTTITSGRTEERLHTPRSSVDELPTDALLLPGNYAAQVRSTAGGLKGTASIYRFRRQVRLHAALPGGCVITGSLSDRPSGNLYAAQTRFGAQCRTGTGPFTGHAFQSYVTRNTYVLLTSESGIGAMLLFTPLPAP